MARNAKIETLKARREKLMAELENLNKAIKFAEEKEQQKRHAELISALEKSGVLNRPVAEIVAALTAQQSLKLEQPESSGQGNSVTEIEGL